MFCKIASREIASKILFETADVVAFSDVRPVAPTHALVVPRKHIASLNDAKEEDAVLLGQLMLAAGRVAREASLGKGWRLIVNTGPDAGQSVFHVHLHILGGRTLDWPPG